MLIEPIYEFNDVEYELVYYASVYKNADIYTGFGVSRVDAIRSCLAKLGWSVIKWKQCEQGSDDGDGYGYGSGNGWNLSKLRRCLVCENQYTIAKTYNVTQLLISNIKTGKY